MKKAIEKAFKLGLKIDGHTWEVEDIERSAGGLSSRIYLGRPVAFGRLKKNHMWISLLELISFTDFVDKLVGKGGACKGCAVKESGAECNGCSSYKAGKLRSIMSNIRDIEELKQYIRGLV
jgi:hypothetical protein